MRKRLPVGPYGRPVPRALWQFLGGGLFLMSEVPLYTLFAYLLDTLFANAERR